MLSLLLALSCSSDQGIGTIPSPPEVLIATPTEGTDLRQGQGTITINATVSDRHDAPDTLALVWEYGEDSFEDVADSDGNVSIDLDVDLLLPGPHVVHLTATDTDGDYGDDSLDLVIGGPISAPTVEITAPSDGSSFLDSELITFQGEASDEATDVDELVFLWESDLDGALAGEISADGRSVLVTDALSTGTHLVSLSVTDTDGDIGSDSITVNVGVSDDPVEATPGDVVFSELMINPQAVDDEVGEWVELYNTSSSPIQIEGYTFRDDDFDYWVLEGSMIVQPFDYFVLCAELNPSLNGGVTCDGWFLRDADTPGLALANSPDEVVLMRPDGVEIDWLHYEDDWWNAGIAMGLDPSYLDGGSNDDPSHWCDQTTVLSGGSEPGTPGLENDPC